MTNDLEALLTSALTSDAQQMFPDGTPPPALARAAAPRRRLRGGQSVRWLRPAVVAAAVIVVISAAAMGLHLAGLPADGTDSAGSAGNLGPACPTGWEAYMSVQLTTAVNSGLRWTVGLEDPNDDLDLDPDVPARLCLAARSQHGSVQTSIVADTYSALKGVGIVRIEGESYLWGAVTPAVKTVTATDSQSGWSGSWAATSFHKLPTALEVFVLPVGEAAGSMTVRALGPDDVVFGEVVV